MAPKTTKPKGKAPAAKPAPKGKSATPAKAAPAKGKAAPAKGKAAPAKGKAAPAKAAPAKGKAGASKAAAQNAKLKAIKQAAAESEGDDADGDESKRNFGLRGAAPWVARHAAKHAEELRKRNAEPPPPGSARATLRTPKEAEEIKGKISLLHQRVGTINTLRKKLDKSFFEIGDLLDEVQRDRLFEAKGYATFESFLDREIEIPRPQAQKIVRIVHTFDRETARDYPLDRLLSALSALDGETPTAAPSQAAASSRSIVGSGRGFSPTALPPKPPIRWD